MQTLPFVGREFLIDNSFQLAYCIPELTILILIRHAFITLLYGDRTECRTQTSQTRHCLRHQS
jgi:hypothetical protein